jgi:membrane-associated phospholipid phosphatase
VTEAALKASIQSAQWPDGACWRAYLRFLGLFLLYFALVYFGLGSLSVWLGRSMDLYAAWETRIPCVPFMVWIYLSLYAIFTLPLLHMSSDQMSALSRQSTVMLLVAGATFLALPGRLGYLPAAYTGIDGSILAFLDGLSATTGHNLVPSLHVAFSALILLSCRDLVSWRLSLIYIVWLVLICASTVLTHQHHLLDIATGLALAISVRWLTPLDRGDASPTSR